MTLEFNKLIMQVTQMGLMLEQLRLVDVHEKLDLAYRIFQQLDDINRVRERIEWVRQSDVSGYRGAAPFPLEENAEAISFVYNPPEATPSQATIIAADGSQIYPDEQAAIHYYLINIGLFIFHYGTDRTPEQITYPDLRYHPAHVHDTYGSLIRNSVIDDRRTVMEMQALGKIAWDLQRNGQAYEPLVCLYDNRLLYLPGNPSHSGENFLKDYWSAMTHIQDSGAILAGYIDGASSRRFMQLLFLMSLADENEVKMRQRELPTAGELEGLRDHQFFNWILEVGQRSAIMVQNSPQNYLFKQHGQNYEIAYFYLKVAHGKIVRVDIPVWVGRNSAMVDALHGVLLSQCHMQGRNPYPYALTRADEIAVVTARDKAHLEKLVHDELWKKGINPHTLSAKTWGKTLARSEKRNFEL